MDVYVETKERAKSAVRRSDRRAQAHCLRLDTKGSHHYRSCCRLGQLTPRAGARTCFRERERPPRALWSRGCLVFRNTYHSRRLSAAKLHTRGRAAHPVSFSRGTRPCCTAYGGTPCATASIAAPMRSALRHEDASRAWRVAARLARGTAQRPQAVPKE